MAKRILLTGGVGLIESNLLDRLLDEGKSAVTVDNMDSCFVLSKRIT